MAQSNPKPKTFQDLIADIKASEKKSQVFEQGEFNLGSNQLAPTPATWSENHIEYPTDLARISPFKPLRRGQKREFISEVLFKNQFGEIQYKGVTLGIDDEDVFMLLLRMGREQLFQSKEIIKVSFGIREFLRKLGRSESGKSAMLLKESLQRLRTAQIILDTKRFSFGGGFINEWKIDKEFKKCTVTLHPDLARFYISKAYTQISYEQRLLLTGDLTKALHRYLNSQRNRDRNNQYSCDLQTLRQVLNSDSQLAEFKRKIKNSMIQLHQIGFLEHFRFDSRDSLFVVISNKA